MTATEKKVKVLIKIIGAVYRKTARLERELWETQDILKQYIEGKK